MIFARTQRCREYGHPEVRLSFDETVVEAERASELLKSIEEEVSRGVRYKSGQSLQVGWSIVEFVDMSDGTLELQEPDFRSFPIRYVDSMTRTLTYLSAQNAALASIGASLEDQESCPTLYDSALLCDRAFKSRSFMMERRPPAGNDSGWFIGCLEKHDHNKPKSLIRESLYRVALEKPEVIDLLLFPVGILLAFRREDGFTIYKNGSAISVAQGSYLAEKSALLRRKI